MTVSWRMIRSCAVAAATSAVLFASVSPAGAQADCGTSSLAVTEVRLLNDGVANTAGPFEIDIPAGVYDLTLVSWDAHDEHYQPEQTQEQWYIELDSGYVSSPSTDIADDQNWMITTLAAQEIQASTKLTIHHLGEGNVNSVEPTCVGFTPVVLEEAAAEEVPGTEVQGIVELPGTQLVPPVVPIGPDSAVESGQVAPQLALTGPSRSLYTALAGMSLILAGWTALWTERRRAAARDC